MKLVITKHRIECCHECPHFAREQGGIMYCHISKKDDGYIITRENMHTYPADCPLDDL